MLTRPVRLAITPPGLELLLARDGGAALLIQQPVIAPVACRGLLLLSVKVAASEPHHLLDLRTVVLASAGEEDVHPLSPGQGCTREEPLGE